MSTLIIAEAGVNHGGDLATARMLVDAAAEAGADLVKFQTFSADKLVTVDARKADYQNRTTGSDESQYAMLRRLELTREMHEELIAHCKSRGIGFFSTGFDESSVDMLVELGADRFKIPSGEITNLPYLRHVGQYGKPVILSTGMAAVPEIEAAMKVLRDAGTPAEQITLLHCTTEYPAPMAEVNLRAMVTLRETLGVPVGYSDHTMGIEVPIAAVALGAVIIEKHLTLSRQMEGPDHKASLEPAEFASMVSAIRNIEAAMGDGVKRVTLSEIGNRAVARKSIVAAVAIRSGDVFGENNLTVKRPGTGLSPMIWDDVIGKKAQRDFAAGELIEL